MKHIFYLVSFLALIAACTEEKKQANAEPKKIIQKLEAPFKKHQKVEVGPGLIFDVFSWGRGSDSISSLLILKSDSLANDFTVSTSQNLDGQLSEVFNTDMDIDGNPEVIVIYRKNDEYKSASVLCYEFRNDANKISFPDLSSKTKQNYRGNDNFYVKEGKLYRQLPLYDKKDSLLKAPIEKKLIAYTLENNSFKISEITP